MDAVISVEHLRKRYGATDAVVDVSFEVAQGEIFGLLGPNGAGKTTTIEIVQGLRVADGGRASVLGLDPATAVAELRRRIGSQLQDSALPARMRVWEALDLFGSLSPRDVDWHELLDKWGLGTKRDTAFANLSGGQQQRLFVALALVSDPEVVFLDEMTTGLDPAARRIAWQLIEQVRDRGTTVVLVTHFMDEAERLCDRVAVVDAGRVIALDTPQALVAKHDPWERVIFASDLPDLDWLMTVPGAKSLSRRGRRVVLEGEGPLLALTAAALVARGIVPEDLRVEEPTLEDAFLRLTGHLMED